MEQKSQGSRRFSYSIGFGLLWLFFLYIYIQLLSFNQGNIDNLLLGGLYFILLGIHEVSHIVFSFFPDILTAAAGSLSEIVFTGIIVVLAFRERSYWALVFGLLWLMMALVSTGNYMADAKPQSIPLVGPSATLVHDWNFVFSSLGWLEASEAIGKTIKVIGWIVGGCGLLFGLTRILKT